MIKTDIEQHYSQFRDTYTDAIEPDIFVGAELDSDWMLLEAIARPPEHLSSSNKGGIVLSTGKAAVRAPLVYKVHLCGPAVTKYKVSDLVIPTFAAGSRLGDSAMCLIQEKHVIAKWGEGLKRVDLPAVDGNAQQPTVSPLLAALLK
jgi:hypothetical protein